MSPSASRSSTQPKGDPMSGRLEGKVAFITGAARGQGRSHAVRLAQEGADIIAVDLMEQIESNPYPLATPEDMKEPVRLVEAQDRRIIASKADVRSRDQLREALENGVAQFGRLDIVWANAGILPLARRGRHSAPDGVRVDHRDRVDRRDDAEHRERLRDGPRRRGLRVGEAHAD